MCGGVGSIIAKGGSNVNPCVKPKLKRPLLGCRGGAGVGSGATGACGEAVCSLTFVWNSFLAGLATGGESAL